MVHKISAIFFLCMMLLSQTPFQQLLKIPVLIEHFAEHRKEAKNISFTDFIKLHYFSGNPKDSDYDRDQQLPFRTADVIVVYSSIVIPDHHFKVGLPPAYNENLYPLFNITSLPQRHVFEIWQPPKFC